MVDLALSLRPIIAFLAIRETLEIGLCSAQECRGVAEGP